MYWCKVITGDKGTKTLRPAIPPELDTVHWRCSKSYGLVYNNLFWRTKIYFEFFSFGMTPFVIIACNVKYMRIFVSILRNTSIHKFLPNIPNISSPSIPACGLKVSFGALWHDNWVEITLDPKLGRVWDLPISISTWILGFEPQVHLTIKYIFWPDWETDFYFFTLID